MTTTDSHYIIRAPYVRAAFEARHLLADAEAAAAAIRHAAETEAERIRRHAEDEAAQMVEAARSRGREETAREAAALMAGASEALDRFWREREAELRDVAVAVAHKILSSLPVDDLMLALASEAIAEHGRDAGLALKASPDTAERLRAALAATGAGARVTVSADPFLKPGDCALLHPRGRTEIGLVAQFRALVGGSASREDTSA